jgi:hypothetical protein
MSTGWASAVTVITIIIDRRLNCSHLRFRFGGSALVGSVCMAALSAAASSRSTGSANRGEAVRLCPFVSDSRFNSPGVLQNQLKG